jgi:hypothetical protein
VGDRRWHAPFNTGPGVDSEILFAVAEGQLDSAPGAIESRLQLAEVALAHARGLANFASDKKQASDI